MKRFFVILSAVFISNSAMAAFSAGSNNTCFYDTHKRDEFWFCGAYSDSKCGGRKIKKRHIKNYIYHGKSFTHNGETYWCCNGTTSKIGNFMKGNSWTISSPETVNLQNGATCTYTKKTTICGEELTQECTAPTKCSGNYVLRNDICTEPCGLTDANIAYASATDNTCVSCPTTQTQGVDSNDICVKCNGANEFWDANKKSCVVKNTLQQIPASVLKKCWECAQDQATYQKCVDVFNKPAADQTKHPDYAQVKQDCNIKD
ncbi:MAG: hypothetical protein E7011_04950 [Alphaproteobacteria bacterium]|nr:hypothetical protein [Alphaproteobacteria bacterium]